MTKRLRVYLSSTFDDLKEYRLAVSSALAKSGLDVVRMEDYTASDERPVGLCLRDVADSHIYVGLFAWRYGFRPPEQHRNPERKSITELEYLRAGQKKNLARLVFLAQPDTLPAWPDLFKDDVTGEGDRGEQIKRLRKELATEKTVEFFRDPDQLAQAVQAAIIRFSP
jgi:hypothetical protein